MSPIRDSNPAISASERPQTHALDRAATGTAGLGICLGLIQGFLAVLRFFPVSVIPQMPCIHLHLRFVLIRTTNERSVGIV